MLTAWVRKGLVCVEAKTCRQKQSGGVGGRAALAICKRTILAAWVRNSCSMGLEALKQACPALKKQKSGGGGGQPPPYLQTQCSQHGFGREPARLKTGGSLFLYFCLRLLISFRLWFFLSFLLSFGLLFFCYVFISVCFFLCFFLSLFLSLFIYSFLSLVISVFMYFCLF